MKTSPPNATMPPPADLVEAMGNARFRSLHRSATIIADLSTAVTVAARLAALGVPIEDASRCGVNCEFPPEGHRLAWSRAGQMVCWETRIFDFRVYGYLSPHFAGDRERMEALGCPVEMRTPLDGHERIAAALASPSAP